MAFMDSIETVCEACGGLRYSPEALRYTVDGLTIAEVMDLTVRKASLRFAGTVIAEKLRPLMLVGLGYLHLNQALSTLSGGELQRVKLASYLGTQSKVFVLDEPTDGLHVKDIRHIISLFDSMAVSYTHLDVYKRQFSKVLYFSISFLTVTASETSCL